MLATSTVENYLKAIYAGVARLGHGQRLLPMGQLAAAVGVTPGTATTMVKTLAESGLVNYEPYAGVSPTRARRPPARRARSAASSCRGAVPRAGHGPAMGRGARRGGAARTRRVGSADRSH